MLTLNRSAIIIKPRQPFLDWLHLADPTSHQITLAQIREDPTIYLIAEGGDKNAVRTGVRADFEVIFEEQLESWYADRATWPARRSFATFCEWFDVEFHSTVMDVAATPARTDGN